MQLTSGYAGGGGLVSPVSEPAGHEPRPAFLVELGPSVELKIADWILQQDLFVGLLTRKPNADGNGYEEATTAATRQRLLLPARPPGSRAVKAYVAFPSLPVPPRAITYVGLFSVHGRLLCSGRVIPQERGGAVIHWVPSTTTPTSPDAMASA